MSKASPYGRFCLTPEGPAKPPTKAIPDANRNRTRAAHGRAAGSFLRWCEGRNITRIENVKPVHVAAYIEELIETRKAPTVKQHLACIRMLFERLVTGQIVAPNQAHAVRGAASFRDEGLNHGTFRLMLSRRE
jgi:site-specific recombinase XerD